MLLISTNFQRKINQATVNYDKNQQQAIIHKNIKPFFHPFYTEYAGLQKICLQILTYEDLKYGDAKDKIYGVLHVLKAYIGGFVNPQKDTNTKNFVGTLNGFGGDVYQISIGIPSVASSFPDFCSQIQANEHCLVSSISNNVATDV